MKFKCNPLVLLFITTIFCSCANDLDFDQIDLEHTPVINTPLVFFELDQNDFFDDIGAIEISSVSDISEFRLLESSTIRDHVVFANVLFEVNNQFDRLFNVNVVFLDDNDDVTMSLTQFTILPGDPGFELREGISISNNPSFLTSTKIRVTISLVPSGVILDPDIPRTFKFKSSGIFYLRF
ncbi:MAG: hypothetical protein JKY02_09590 [Flavobacteriaceae bacterium]|nr:hypothetical protein [Flavobacteriaceae bacterium]